MRADTRATLPWPQTLAIAARDRDGDPHREAVRSIIELNLAIQRGFDLALDELRAKAAPRRLANFRSVALAPIQDEAALLHGPGHRNPAFRLGQRPIFGCIGCKLVEDEAERQRSPRIEQQGGAL